MLKLPIRTWILNAAAVLAGRHGTVTSQAKDSRCSRQTVYEHARKVEQRLAAVPDADAMLAELRAENQGLCQQIDALKRRAQDPTPRDPAVQRRLAVTAFAMGLSLRQIEELLGLLLPPAEAPDHSTLGRWVQAEARRATAVLAKLDTACAERVRTLCLDEIFFGGDRPWSASSRPA